jgi:orotate phosphoribosyltransferase
MQERYESFSQHIDLKQRLLSMIKRDAVMKQEVTLASGQKSDQYIDCRQIYFRGEAQFIIGELFFDELVKLESTSLPFTACGGMALGAIPLSCALTSAAFRRGRELPGFCVRKAAKDHGIKAVIEGNKCLQPGTKVLMVEDVVTTGSSSLQAIDQLRAQEILVDTLFSIVDRESSARSNLKNIGVELSSCFTLSEILRS